MVQDSVLPAEDKAGPAATVRLLVFEARKLKVHWSADSGLEGDEE
jgi:hypothetical protein